jgi:hypothetical protein
LLPQPVDGLTQRARRNRDTQGGEVLAQLLVTQTVPQGILDRRQF